MTLIMATWAHGNAVVAQRPAGTTLQDVGGRHYTAVVGFREGGTAIYEGTGSTALTDTDTFFHIPVPTVSWLPTMAGGGSSGRAFLDNFCILFRAENCTVTGVEAWDGGRRFFLAGIPNIGAEERLSGDWSEYGKTINGMAGNRRITLSNLFTPREPAGRHPMLFGLGISIRVDFTSSPHPKRIIFLGAGASWHDLAIG